MEARVRIDARCNELLSDSRGGGKESRAPTLPHLTEEMISSITDAVKGVCL